MTDGGLGVLVSVEEEMDRMNALSTGCSLFVTLQNSDGYRRGRDGQDADR